MRLWWTLRQLKSSNPEVRRRAVQNLGERRETPAVKALVNTLYDKDPQVREEAVETLRKLGDQVVEMLIAALEDHRILVQEGAVEVLGRIGSERAVEALAAALDNRSIFVRKAAQNWLVKTDNVQVIEEVEANNLTRWRESGQAWSWVQAHKASWSHGNWLTLLETLKKSEFWPMKPDAVGEVIEGFKREWLERERKRQQEEEENKLKYGPIIFDQTATSAGICSRCGKGIEPIVDPMTGTFRYFRGDPKLKVCDGQICVNCQSRLCFNCHMSETCPNCSKAMMLIISGF
jgi:hypothetical protein